MKNNPTKEIAVSIILIVLTILLLNPLNFWMPDMVVMIMLVLTIVCFALLAVFILKEKVQDEREMVNRMFSGRVAFLVGSFLITIGIMAQALDHSVDKWLVIVFVGMVLSKIIARIYSDSRM